MSNNKNDKNTTNKTGSNDQKKTFEKRGNIKDEVPIKESATSKDPNAPPPKPKE